MKHFLASVVLLCLGFGLAAQLASAQIQYVPLSPLPYTTKGVCNPDLPPDQRKADPNCKTDLSTYIPGLFKLLIGVAGGLAVIWIVIGGVQYLSTDAIQGKEEGKQRIRNALTGLILAIASYIILNTINPDILSFKLSIQRQPPPSATLGPGTGPPPTLPISGPWPDDGAERTQLSNGGVTINRANCTQIGQQSCTSVHGLSQRAIAGALTLKRDCDFSCQVVITGGTEYWLHSANTAHRPGGNVLDFRPNSILDSYIKTKGVFLPNDTSCSVGNHYTMGTVMYVEETILGNAPHWHVCF